MLAKVAVKPVPRPCCVAKELWEKRKKGLGFLEEAVLGSRPRMTAKLLPGLRTSLRSVNQRLTGSARYKGLFPVSARGLMAQTLKNLVFA